MPNIAVLLKEEMSRLARKEIRSETTASKKASAQHRRDIAELKRQVSSLQGRVSSLEKQVLRNAPPPATDADAKGVRFTAKGLRSQRKRLGLSAAGYGKLIGVTPQSIYNWESEVSRPRQQQLAALASIRHIGKKEAQARLEKLTKSSRKKS